MLALGACGGAEDRFGGSDGRATADDVELVCGDASLDDGDLAAMPRLDTLPDAVLAAVDDAGAPAVDASLDWRVAAADDDEVVLIREVDPNEPAAARGDTHATMRLGPITGAPNIPDGAWFLWGSGSCTPRLADGAGDGQAELRLADIPSAGDTELTLLVRERRCASGRSAEGRIDLDELTLTEDEVRVRVSVRPPPVSRRRVDTTESPTDAEPEPPLAPSLAEVLEQLRAAYEDNPDSIIDIAVEESGMLIRVAFDPIRQAVDDEIGYRFEVDVDSPGDPVPGK